MKRVWFSLSIISLLLLMPFSTNVMGVDNLIENGTFDTDMDGWNIATSQNFSITSNAGVCDVNTTHTDWLSDLNGTLLNATTYNMTIGSGDPSGKGLTHYASIDNTTTNILNATFDNYSLNGFEYVEDMTAIEFLDYNISNDFNLSEPLSLSTQGIKIHNFTELTESFNSTETGYSLENGTSDFVWGDNQLECLFEVGRESYYLWNITSRYNTQNPYILQYEVKSNMTLLENRSYFSVGYGNSANILNKDLNNMIQPFIFKYNDTISYPHVFIRNTTGTGHAMAGSILNYFNTSNLTTGIKCILTSDINSLISFEIRDATTDYSLMKLQSAGLGNININSVVVRNFFGSSGKQAQVNITNITSQIDLTNTLTSGSQSLIYDFQLPNETARLNVNTNRHHYHDAQNGIVRSSLNLYSGDTKVVNDNRTTTTNPADSLWYNYELDYKNAEQNNTLQLWNYFTLTEGSTTYPAKAVYWDNITIDVIEYDSNSSYTSQVFDRGYYADWQEIVLYFNGLDGSYPIPMFPYGWNTIFNLTVYTRVGDHAIVDGTWSSWEETQSQTYSTEGDLLKWSSYIPSKNGRYIQYCMDIELWKRGLESPIFLYGNMSSLPIIPSTEWGSFTQDIIKPYSNYTTLKYDYKIHELNNTINGTIQVSFGNTLINQHNYSITETAWQYIEVDLPNIYNSSGTYNLNFTIITNFNSTNGTSTIFFDNVEILIEEQAPTITSFNIYNTTSKAIFNGTFKDLTIGSDYEYLGMDGIDSVNIRIGNTVLDIIDYQYIDNGTFEFNYIWSNIPFEMEEIEMNATLTVKDTSDLEGTDISSITFPNTSTVLTFLIAQVFIIIIVFVLIRYFYLIWCDSDHDGKKDKECKI